MTSGSNAVLEPVRYDQDGGRSSRDKRRILYGVFTVVVSAVVLFAVFEAVTGVTGFGIDSATAKATSVDTALTVRYARATRGQLVSPFEVTVRRAGGFDGPVTLAVSRSYLDLFLSDGVAPEPSSETSTADTLLLTFDPPPTGDTLRVRWDLLAKPSSFFTSRDAFVSVVDLEGAPIVTATFETTVHV